MTEIEFADKFKKWLLNTAKAYSENASDSGEEDECDRWKCVARTVADFTTLDECINEYCEQASSSDLGPEEIIRDMISVACMEE